MVQFWSEIFSVGVLCCHPPNSQQGTREPFPRQAIPYERGIAT